MDLVSDGELIEGAHYTFMYYSGKVLSHFEAVPDDGHSTLVSMVTTNRNVAIVMDSDRKRKPGSKRKPSPRINSTKKRLIDGVRRQGGFSWVTAGKEIENYIPVQVWQRLGADEVSIRDEFVNILELEAIKEVSSSKTDLAHRAAGEFLNSDFVGNLDLKIRIDELIEHIKK